MRRAGAILLGLCLLATPLHAGAWLEPEGQGFVSSGLRLRPSGQEVHGYAAYGVTPRLTLGLDLNRAEAAGSSSAHALVFARLPLRQSDSGWQLATELSFGLGRNDVLWQPLQRVTLSAARGFDSPWGNGWIALDLAREWQPEAHRAAVKLDATLGLNSDGRAAPIVQLELYQPDQGVLSWKLLPGLRWQLAPGRELLCGLELSSARQGRVGLNLALWHRF